MVEAIFISTVIFAVYVIYRVTDEGNKDSDSVFGVEPEEQTEQEQPAADSAPSPEPVAEVAAAAEPVAEVAAAAEPVADVEAAAEPEKPAPAADKPESSTASKEVRNPDTGEIATIPSNYRFTKRWIKEALVTEGLLDKIYKNNELDDEASSKVKDALETFKTLEKYRP